MERIGTAGWTIPAASRERFAREGSQLERYAARFNAVEINSTFYRPHRPSTYARWAASVPAAFAFALKAPKEITHARRLIDCGEPLRRFLDESAALGEKRAMILIQLPPSLAFDAAVAAEFFAELRAVYDGDAVCEPRHGSWFAEPADALLRTLRIARAGADPACVPAAAAPGGWAGIAYLRLHGSPRTYYSAYGESRMAEFADRLRANGAVERWCIFDNTALGAAASDALCMQRALAAAG